MMDKIKADKSNPEQTRIEQLNANLLADGKRVRAALKLNDAGTRPTIEFTLLDEQLSEIARSIIIGIIDRSVNFTLHPGKVTANQVMYLRAAVITNDNEIVETRQVIVESKS